MGWRGSGKIYVMTYQVLARKWRPKSFATLVGQEHVVRALNHALQSQRLHHAYLFTGTRGVGKTTLARILAKALNCEGGITPTPCGQCSACREIDGGRFVDLIEIDAATNTGIDDVRALQDNATYAPTRGRFKVFVIDEVHMLSKPAFNSLLKTLEEPPSHIKFILATTDPQKIPVTVLSRCLQFNLKQMPPPHIVEHLSRVLEQEGVPFEPAALRHLAKAAAGSMRDALSLLDQAIAHGAGRVEEGAVRDMLGTVGEDHLHAVLEGLLAGDVAAMLTAAQAMVDRSLSFDSALQELGALVQRAAVLQLAPGAISDGAEAERLRPYAEGFSAEFLQLAYQILAHGRSELPLAPDEYAGFVMTLLRLAAFRPAQGGAEQEGVSAVPPSSMPRAGAQARRVSPSVALGVEPACVDTNSGATTREVATEVLPSPRGETLHAGVGQKTIAPPGASSQAGLANSVPKPEIGDWHGMISAMGLTGLARELAHHCEWLGMEGSRVRLRLSQTHRFLGQTPGTTDRMRGGLEAYFGRPIHLDLTVGEVAGETPAQRNQAEQRERHARAVAAVEQDGFVREMIEVFDASLNEASIKPI